MIPEGVLNGIWDTPVRGLGNEIYGGEALCVIGAGNQNKNLLSSGARNHESCQVTARFPVASKPRSTIDKSTQSSRRKKTKTNICCGLD